jgi:hypothetical protein
MRVFVCVCVCVREGRRTKAFACVEKKKTAARGVVAIYHVDEKDQSVCVCVLY